MSDHFLDKKILTYQDVANIPSGSSDEMLVDVRTYDSSIVSKYEKMDMLPYTGEVIYVRDIVAKKLANVQSALRQKNLSLRIVYGYRHPEIQEDYFARRREVLRQENPSLSEDDLNLLTHNFVAVPDVAGHPTGGAVDLTLINKNGSLTVMGTAIADYQDSEKMKTFGFGLTEVEKINRMTLHDAMRAEEFAPFYGEWWHFSYGDREWASFYEKTAAIYGPITFQKKEGRP